MKLLIGRSKSETETETETKMVQNKKVDTSEIDPKKTEKVFFKKGSFLPTETEIKKRTRDTEKESEIKRRRRQIQKYSELARG